MSKEYIEQLKSALQKCEKENENRETYTFEVIVSKVCKDAKNCIEALENKIADIKANCDLAIEGRDMKIKELEQELTVEKDLHQEETNLHLHAENYIKSLEQQIVKMKCCGNCGNKRCTSKYRGNSAYHTQADGFACAENEDWVMRIKEIEK